jgi:hypothetical protein
MISDGRISPKSKNRGDALDSSERTFFWHVLLTREASRSTIWLKLGERGDS